MIPGKGVIPTSIVETLRQEHRRLGEAARAFSPAIPALPPSEILRRLGEIKTGLISHVEKEERELLAALDTVSDAQARNLARMYRATMKPVTERVKEFFARYSTEGSLSDREAFRRDWQGLLEALGARIQVEEGQFFPACEKWLEKTMVP